MQGVRQFFVYIWENQWLREKVECFLLYHFCSGVKHVAVEIEYREKGQITIYESVRSIEHFHELYQRVFLAKE